MSGTTNSFEGGLHLDYPDYQTPKNVYTFANNATFLTHEGNELILQNEKGTVYQSSLKEDYIAVAVADYTGIAYIISAQVINNEFTGRGEIGTFPSPDYANKVDVDCTAQGCNYETTLIPEYQAFQNYSGDNGNPINSLIEVGYGEFTSDLFNFQKDKPVEIVATQTSYDGSVNIIFTDNFNKPKLINSRFTVRPNNKVTIVNRAGSNDTNLYAVDNFNNTLNHIFSSNKLATVTFDGQSTGGDLATGQYRYFFQYLTVDGNVTNVFAESFNIPVFFGNSVATTRGGLPNENTDKSNKLTIHNIDQAYSSIRVYFQYSAGTVGADAQQTVYKIEEEYDIKGTEVTITHSGFETITAVENAELSLDFSLINTYRTGCEIKSRLAVGNIKLRQYDVNILFDFAKKIKVFETEKKMTIPGFDTDKNHSNIYSNIAYDAVQRDTFVGGYYNPRNVHDNLGYWGGETYMFGVTFIFEDGAYSPVIPIRGIDNFNNNAVYNDANLFIDDDFDKTTGENIRGVYRFSRRTKKNYIVTSASSYVNVLLAEFEIPQLPQTILDLGVVGYRFHRSRRKLDCIGQGILINTVIIPTDDGFDFSQPEVNPNSSLATYYKAGFDEPIEGYTENNSRYIPSFNYLLETVSRKNKRDKDDSRGPHSPSVDNQGIEPVQMYAGGYNGAIEKFWFNKKFAFLSPDFIGNPVNNSRLFSTDSFSFEKLGEFYSIYAVPTTVPFKVETTTKAPWAERDVNHLRYFSLIKPTSFLQTPLSPFIKCSAEYVTGEVTSTTSQGFSSATDIYAKFRYQLGEGIVFDGKTNSADTVDYGLLNYIFNDYVGITTENPFIINPNYPTTLPVSSTFVSINQTTYDLGPTTGAGTKVDGGRVNTFNFTNNVTTGDYASVLINVYRGSGPRNLEQLSVLYQPEGEAFFPITQPLYETNALANAVQASGVNGILQTKQNLSNSKGRLEAANGDCFINLTHRRLFYSGLDRNDPGIEVGVTGTNVGYTIAFIAESNYNVAGRYENFANVAEQARTFYPFEARNHKIAVSTSSVKGEDDKWRIARSLETKQYNTGYDSFEGGRNYVAISSRLPFIQNQFNTRVWISEPYTSASFENQYRFFLPLAYKDYSQEFGEIVSLKSQGDVIIMIQEFGITVIPVSQRIAQRGDSAGAVFFASSDVLASVDNSMVISTLHGSQWQFSIVSTDNYTYGVDLNTSKIWRTRGQSLELISDVKIQSFLRKIRKQYDNQEYEWFFRQVRTYYDKRRGDVIFTFAATAEGDVCGTSIITIPSQCININGDENGIILSGGVPLNTVEVPNLCYNDSIFNLVYNEQMNHWKTFNSWYPSNMFSIYDEIYSLPLLEKRNKIYKHYENDKYAFYYDEQHDFIVEINVTSDTKMHQTFNNLFLVTNEFYPYKIEYTTSTGTVIQDIKPRNVEGRGAEPYRQQELNPIAVSDFVYKEDHLYGEIRPNDWNRREYVDKYGNTTSLPERRVRDKFCKIRFYYNTSNNVYIQQIITNVNRSYS